MAIAQIWLLRMFKAYNGRTNDKQWSNTYHIASDADVADPLWVPVIQAVLAGEAAIHNTNVNFMRATLSTWRIEPVYDPKNLKVMELNGTGQRGFAGGSYALPLDLALKVKKNVDYGRSGTMYYRGVLNSLDVNVGAGGDATLISPGDGNLLNNIHGFPSTLLTSLAGINGSLVMPPKMGAPGAPDTIGEARGIGSFDQSGVSVNRRNHRYFDKAASDDGVGVGT